MDLHLNKEKEMSEWREDRKLVMHVLKENTRAMEKLSEKIDNLAITDTKLANRLMKVEMKSGAFGVIGGGFTLFMAFIFEWVKGKII